MNLWWWAGFSPSVIRHVQSRQSVRIFLDQLAISFVLLWLFILSGSFGFFIMATHDFFFAFFGSLVFGFVQWNVIRLTNASIHIAPHEYDAYLRAMNNYEVQKKQWDVLSEEEKKKKSAPKEITLSIPSFFKPTLFFMGLSILSGMVWGIGLSTEYIIEIKGPPKEIIIQEILTRTELATQNAWLQIGGAIGMLVALIPSFIRWMNSDALKEMHLNVVSHDHSQIIQLHQEHTEQIKKELQIPTFATQFLDPPFNNIPKIMGWIHQTQCHKVIVPKWEPPTEDDTPSVENENQNVDTQSSNDNSSPV